MSDHAELIAETKERVRTLSVCADLYDEIHAFMHEVTSRTYEAFDASKVSIADTSSLQLKHITAMSIRADYQRTSKENRDDVALYERLLKVIDVAEALTVGISALCGNEPNPSPTTVNNKGET